MIIDLLLAIIILNNQFTVPQKGYAKRGSKKGYF